MEVMLTDTHCDCLSMSAVTACKTAKNSHLCVMFCHNSEDDQNACVGLSYLVKPKRGHKNYQWLTAPH